MTEQTEQTELYRLLADVTRADNALRSTLAWETEYDYQVADDRYYDAHKALKTYLRREHGLTPDLIRKLGEVL